jgi:HSP20 family protein
MEGVRSMTIVSWDPFKEVATLQDRINRLFDDAFPKKGDSGDDTDIADWRPAVDIFETKTAVVLEVELPGVIKEDVSVEVKENILTIKGERKVENEDRKDTVYRRERAYGLFKRAFNLHYVVKPEKIKARFNDGVLRIEVPKPEEEKPKQVTVNVD